MKLAEELYQAGFISYPRTETDQFDAGYDLLVRAAQMLPQLLLRFNPLLKSDMTGLGGSHGKSTICPAVMTEMHPPALWCMPQGVLQQDTGNLFALAQRKRACHGQNQMKEQPSATPKAHFLAACYPNIKKKHII